MDDKTTIPRLTPAQREMLCDLLRPGEQRGFWSRYRPLLKLLDLGLVQQRPQKYGAVLVSLTAEGARVREALVHGR